jgi:hypothetical protein
MAELERAMAAITVAIVNGEWMNDWFSPDAEPVGFRPTFERDGATCTTDQAAGRLAGPRSFPTVRQQRPRRRCTCSR